MFSITSPSERAHHQDPSFKANALLVILVTLLLTLVPLLITAHLKPSLLLQHTMFAIFMASCIFFYYLILTKHRTWWSQVLAMLGIWGFAIGFDILFSPEFDTAFLGYIVAGQIVFALLGPRFGIVMVTLSIASMVGDTYFAKGLEIEARIFTLAVLVTVGVLTWAFVYVARSSRERVTRLVIETTRSKEEAERMALEISRLNRMMLTSQDNERRRLARDIHDGPLQLLGVELLAIDRVKRRIASGEMEKAGAELEYLRELARETISDLRGTVNSLHNTLLYGGIEPALQNLARKLQDQTSLDVQIIVRIGDDLPKPLQNCLYQLALEAANNVKKHSRARRLYIGLSLISARVELRIKDDGQGFHYEEALEREISQGHIGMHSMKERAAELGGTMQVVSTPGHGAELNFNFPTICATTLADPSQDTQPYDQKFVYLADAHRAS